MTEQRALQIAKNILITAEEEGMLEGFIEVLDGSEVSLSEALRIHGMADSDPSGKVADAFEKLLRSRRFAHSTMN